MPALPTSFRERRATAVATIERSGQQALREVETGRVLDALAGPGVVVLRGFEPDLAEFEAFTRRFCKRFHRSAARDQLRAPEGDGYTAQTPDVNFTLLAHSEGSYRPFQFADLAFFLCLVPPSRPGGETLLVDGLAFLDRLPASLRGRFESEGVIFQARWEAERWQAELGVGDASELAEFADRNPQVDYALEDGEMLYRCRRTAIQADRLGRPVFSNAILAHLPAVHHPDYWNARVYTKESNKVYFGGGEQLSSDVINTLIDIQDAVAYAHRPERNDLLIIDNTRVMHGRRPTQGDCPRVLLTRFGYLDGKWNRAVV